MMTPRVLLVVEDGAVVVGLIVFALMTGRILDDLLVPWHERLLSYIHLSSILSLGMITVAALASAARHSLLNSAQLLNNGTRVLLAGGAIQPLTVDMFAESNGLSHTATIQGLRALIEQGAAEESLCEATGVLIYRFRESPTDHRSAMSPKNKERFPGRSSLN